MIHSQPRIVFAALFGVVVPATSLGDPPRAPDEGQWLPQQVLAMDWDALRARGMELDKDEFWHPERGGVLSAAVQINGCSASFVSGEGLVVTNHHCGFGAVQRLSTVERNLLRDGFAAATRADELPAPGMTVSVVRRIRDVSAEVHAAQAAATDDLSRWHATRQVIAELVAEGEREPNTTCHVASFLEGQSYHLYYRTQLTDVRLVYAPPRSVGEFGGEVDNWEWPRHTGDFCFFRAYVAPDGSPRAHSPDNVSFEPEHHLAVSARGVAAGDLVMILGYPGQTERYLTSVAVQDRQTLTYPLRYRAFSAVLDVLARAGAESEEKALAYSSMVKSLANVQKNALGMVRGLARNGVVAAKLAQEEAFRRWVAQTEERRAQFGTALDEVMAIDLAERETLHKDTVIGLLGSSFLNPLLAGLANAAGALSAAAAAPAAAGAEGDAPVPSLRGLAAGRLERDLELVQLPVLEVLLDEARALPEGQRIAGTEALCAAPPEVPTGALLRDMVARSSMLDAAARLELFGRGWQAVEASEDPLVALARGLHSEARARSLRAQERLGRRLVAGRRWIEAQQRWRGEAFYPDANSTLRVSIANVKGYAPRDGVRYTPKTSVAGVVAKETGEEPFASPSALLAAAPERSESRFRDPEIGDVPVCFLSDGDTTGGNSGSPVINGKGELVGLNFDRVFENVAGDYGWRAEVSRNISVDMRYVLWIMEQVMPAPHLLAEMGVAGG